MFSIHLFLAATILFALLSQSWAVTMLGTPHVVSGVIFDDWNANGTREMLEPGLSSVVVSLWYLPAGQYSVLSTSHYIQISSFYTRIGAETNAGQFQFTCLAAGTYRVAVHLSTTRPSRVTTNDTISNGMAWTAPFSSEEAGSTELEIGLSQTIYAVAFSLTGDQTVPPTVTVTTGAGYAVLNTTNPNLPEMYFRIVRGDWPSGQTEEVGGFYEGWADQAPGLQVRSLADLSNEKENVWFVQPSVVNDLLNGKILVQLTATGSFSDKSRLRGQFAQFRRSNALQTSIMLTGASVVPLVSTSNSGSATFFVDLARKQLDYVINYSPLYDEFETSATLNGPAAVGTNGPVVYSLPLGPNKVGSIAGLSDSFLSSLSQSKIYVSIKTDKHPNGLLRGQIRSWQQVQYQSVQNLAPQSPQAGVVQTFGHAVTQIDLEKQTLSYFVAYGGLSANEAGAMLMDTITGASLMLEGDVLPAYEDGVKQGFYYLTSDQINSFLQGKYQYVISSASGTELMGVVNNWS